MQMGVIFSLKTFPGSPRAQFQRAADHLIRPAINQFDTTSKMNMIRHLFKMAFLGAGLAIFGCSLTGLARTVSVGVANGNALSFFPATTNIATGDTVLWTWNSTGITAHSTTSDTNGLWDSTSVPAPHTFMNTFSTPGTFPYHCIPHVTFGMKGTIVVTAPNQPPTVTITNPASGTVFAAPANVTIQASATDDVAVVNVQFLVGSTVLTNDNTAPYSAVTNNLAAGSYTLSAIVTDNNGATFTNSVSIIVDVRPTVTITNPASGTVFAAPASITIQADASDSDGTVTNVQFLVDSNSVTNDPAGPFSAVTNNLAVGSHTLSAVASDNNGLKITNNAVISVVTPVSVLLSAPQPVPPGKIRFTYTANAGLRYIVQSSSNLALPNWTTLVTNTAASGSINFTDLNATLNPGFYRVSRLPNP
jgi:plastocyanin